MARNTTGNDTVMITLFPAAEEAAERRRRASLPPLPDRQTGAKRRWPVSPEQPAYQPVTVLGKPLLWLREDVVAFAMIALGPNRVETVLASLPLDAAPDDRWVTMADGQMVCDRSGAFMRLTDWLFPLGESRSAGQRSNRRMPEGLANQKIARDPAYDLSDMDDESLVQTYRRYARQASHPVTLACVAELARRHSSLAC
jgi:hypothetical protein